jgi:O-antigen/teichoic acid export membrane protein
LTATETDFNADKEPSSGAELRAAALRGLRWTTLGRVIIELSLLGSMVVLARLIPPAEFGPYAVAVVVQELVLGIQTQGVGNALVQRANADRRHLQAGHAIMLVSGILLGILALVAARFVAKPIFGTPTASLVAWTAPLPIVVALGIVPLATLRRKLAFRRLTMIDLTSSLLRAGGSIAMAAVGLGAKSLVFGTLLATAVASIATWISAPPPMPWLHRKEARELLDYGLPASLAAVSWTCFRNCDYAIVGVRLGTLQAGLYFRAYNLGVEYQKKVSDMMVTVAFPVMARTGSDEELSEMRGQVVRLLTMLLFPGLTLLAIVAPVLIPWLLGPDWAPAVVPTQILALGGAATLVMDTAGVALAAAGRSRAMLGFGIAHFAVYAIVVWFIASYGLSAVAIGAAVVHTAFLFVSYAVMLSRSNERPVRHLLTDVAPATVSSLGLAVAAVPVSLALSAAHVPVIVNLALVGLVGGVAYLLALRFAFPHRWREFCSAMRRMIPFEWLRVFKRRPALVEAGSVSTSA